MKYFFSFVLALVSVFAIAQAPKQIPYQGVARNAGGSPLINQVVSLRLSIEEGPGVVLFQEEHQPTTNAFGLFNVQIGSIEEMDIDWGGEMKYLHVELDIAGGTNYVDLGTTAFLSVPYALYAESSGTPGPQGIQGEQGPAGPMGMTGPQGPAGINGIDGQDGAQGPIGPQGIQGEQGPAGPMGMTGPQGVAGINGVDGQDGAQGPAGPVGMTGPQGPAGINGIDGQDGAQGPAGPQGIQGEEGPAGTGVSILGGFASESELPATAMAGDSYLINGDLFVWSSVDQSWISVGNIQGPQGAQGATGATGPQGPIGLTGAVGATGATGDQGPIGLTGPVGAAGATGPQGPIGLNGPAGATGATGATGPQGPIGLTGPAGPQGPIGLTGPQGNPAPEGTITFPDGFTNLIPITSNISYTIPTGKNLYITGISKPTANGINDSLLIDSVLVVKISSTRSLKNPLIVGSNQTVNLIGSSIIFNGFLINENVSPITLSLSSPYTVPSGQQLFITLITAATNGGNLYIDGQKFIDDAINFPLYSPLIINANSTISCTGILPTIINGYIK
jgi:hypothetical protein